MLIVLHPAAQVFERIVGMFEATVKFIIHLRISYFYPITLFERVCAYESTNSNGYVRQFSSGKILNIPLHVG